MKEIESISAALFDKLRSRFPGITLGDSAAKATTDPDLARFFNFTYSSSASSSQDNFDDSDVSDHKKDGVTKFGKVTISLIDETSLKIYYGQNISGEMDREQRQEWYAFLRNLRQFAKRNLLTFDTRDINKSNLNIQDVKQQASTDDVSVSSDIKVTESRLYGTSRNSYEDMGDCRLMIKHDGLVSDDHHGSRTRNIREVFIETNKGERFLLPFKNLHGARAMAQHINCGGAPHDEFGQHIAELVSEMSAMTHFVRSTKHRQFEDQETADMTSAAVNHYDQVKRTLRTMRGSRGYRNYFESYSPSLNFTFDTDSKLEEFKERFVKKSYDARFEAAFPLVYHAYQKQKESGNGYDAALDQWADGITESTWNTPDSEEKISALRELLKTPLMLGIDAIDAQTKLGAIIGDDQLNDTLFHLSQNQGPDADARVVVKQWLVANMPDLLSQMTIGDKNSQDAETNWAQPVSPSSAQGNTYGTQSSNNSDANMANEQSDPLNFIRSLAGLTRQ